MVEPFCTITPTRGDRPRFIEFCKHQLSRMTIQPSETFFVNHEPESKDADITLRVRLGIAMAEAKGIDICYIIEDDDYYPKNYFERNTINGHDFIGCAKTIYYNLKNKTHQEFLHPNRSSLFCTAFRISALKRFSWPTNDTLFLDLHLWKYATKYSHRLSAESGCIGIKHGIGKSAGLGHRIELKDKDPKAEFLKKHVDPEAYAFYMSL